MSKSAAGLSPPRTLGAESFSGGTMVEELSSEVIWTMRLQLAQWNMCAIVTGLAFTKVDRDHDISHSSSPHFCTSASSWSCGTQALASPIATASCPL
jgi:hypothetical protein